jgi:hypothetical protein
MIRQALEELLLNDPKFPELVRNALNKLRWAENSEG